MVQEAGFANVLVVDDIMEALDRDIMEALDRSRSRYVLRAVARSRLSEEEQKRAMYEARGHREHQELPYDIDHPSAPSQAIACARIATK